MIEINKIYNEDCLVGMQKIDDKSIDCIICDLPYNLTRHKWDNLIPFDKLWEQYNRIIKDNGVIALFSIQPFTSQLIMSNVDMYRYSWVWNKMSSNGFLNANYAPLKTTEDINIFSKGTLGSFSKNPITYHPQGVIEINKEKRNNPNNSWRRSNGFSYANNKLNSDEPYTQKYTNYPTNILEFPHDKDTFHPTQKPIDLVRYLVRTYTIEGELVLDNCMGSGTTACACVKENRNYIGFELNEEYYVKSLDRLKNIETSIDNADGLF